MTRSLGLLVLSLSAVGSGCAEVFHSATTRPSPLATNNDFDAFLHAEATSADGFDFAFGDPDGKGESTNKTTCKRFNGWSIATKFAEQYSPGIHPGEG